MNLSRMPSFAPDAVRADAGTAVQNPARTSGPGWDLRLRGFLRAAAVAVAMLPVEAQAGCDGRDILASLAEDERATLVAAAEAQPFPRGNIWRAERGQTRIDVIGTFHIGDQRLGTMMEVVAPLVEDADLVLVEVTPEEEARLAAAMMAEPSIAFLTGTENLRDLLPPDEWERYVLEMEARGVPTMVAARFRPWLAFTTLGIPACALTLDAQAMRGLDDRIITYARELGRPVEGLEDWTVIHALFDTLTEEEALDILRVTLAQAEISEDLFATMSNAYFNGEHRLIWEFSRNWPPELPGNLFTADRRAAVFDRLEESLLLQRNREWLTRVLPRAEGQRAVLAVGAAHLGGRDGVLYLLERAGFQLGRLPM